MNEIKAREAVVTDDVLVVIPTYNERDNLEELMARIRSIGSPHCLFIDDGSRDGTREWIREQRDQREDVHLIERPHKMGLGTAYIEGFKWAMERKYHWILEMDADLSHDPREIPKMIGAGEAGADLIIGSRYLNGIRIINWPLNRLILSRFASSYSRFWTRLPLTDPTSGFKCFHRKVFERISLNRIRSNGYAFQVEIDFFVWKSGFVLREIPIVFTDRHHGSSKMNYSIVREAALMIPMLRPRGWMARWVGEM